MKVGQVAAWLKDGLELGHGHAMAVVALLRGKRAQPRGAGKPPPRLARAAAPI